MQNRAPAVPYTYTGSDAGNTTMSLDTNTADENIDIYTDTNTDTSTDTNTDKNTDTIQIQMQIHRLPETGGVGCRMHNYVETTWLNQIRPLLFSVSPILLLFSVWPISIHFSVWPKNLRTFSLFFWCSKCNNGNSADHLNLKNYQ